MTLHIDWDAPALAIALTVALPVAVGAFWGWRLRESQIRSVVGWLLLVVAPLIGFLAPWIPVGYWNLFAANLIAAVAFWIATSPPPARIAATVSLLFTLVLLELGTRLLASHLPWIDQWGGPSPRFISESCRVAIQHGDIPKLWPEPRSQARDFGAGGPPYHLRLGDSMVNGDELTNELERSFPGLKEAEIAIPGTGPDIQYYLLQRFVREAGAPPMAVTHHLFAGNDIGNLDCDMHFCSGAGILVYDPDGAEPCRHLAWMFSPGMVLAESPPPYLFSVVSPYSQLARLGMGAVRQVANKDHICPTHNADDPHPADWEQRWSHFEAIMNTERDMLARAGIPLVAVVLPYRPSLESDKPERTGGYVDQTRMVATLQKLGIHTLDAWPLFRDAVVRDGSALYFQPNRDVHFSQQGKQLYARWLAEQLGTHMERLATVQAEGAP